MNNTNRALNRVVLLLFGLVLVALGVAAAGAAVVPDLLDQWKSIAGTAQEGSADVVKATTIDGFGHSWILIVVPLLCLLLIVLLLVFIFRQGQGHSRALVTHKGGTESTATGTVIPSPGAGEGTVVIDGKVAEQAIQQALDGHPALVSSSVSTYLVGRTPALRITAQVRRGASPQVVRVFIDQTVAAWDDVLGREVPVLIQINGGLTTKTARASRIATPASTNNPNVSPADPATNPTTQRSTS